MYVSLPGGKDSHEMQQCQGEDGGALLWFIMIKGKAQGLHLKSKVKRYGEFTQGCPFGGLGTISDSEEEESSKGFKLEIPPFLLSF